MFVPIRGHVVEFNNCLTASKIVTHETWRLCNGRKGIPKTVTFHDKNVNDICLIVCLFVFVCFFSAVMQAQPAGPNLFYLVFNGQINGQTDLYITAKEIGQGITLTVRVLIITN